MTDPASLRHTPLHAVHVEMGARMVPFAGWDMPVQYTGIVEEHKAVRQSVGVFDISHMGQFIVSGKGAEVFLNRVLTNNISELQPGQGQYTLLLNTRGGVIDDLIAYRISEREFFLVVNASRIDQDWEQLESQLTSEDDVLMANASDFTAGLAIQGPKAREVAAAVFGDENSFPAHNTILVTMAESGPMWLCGTGYTGEEGFEFFMPAETAEAWFRKIVDAVKAAGGAPCGLGARDTLRLEMGYPLNGNDLSEDRTPLQAGLGFFVDLDKGDFTGREALVAQKAAGLPDKLAAFRMTGAAPPPRPHYPVAHAGEIVGEVCSGTQSPSLGAGIGMVYLPLAATAIGTAIEIEIRGRRFPAEVVKKPFYRKPSV
ncbi:glycine cleavage system aminomethyltransferase GcvT [Prosthecobacter sp.]|uniref:glycine cleavage system aminomethyltransferase GcvT n=1 Tax=Prosthecobacter sp. TaxID=1965333 RepID=UPI0025D5F3DA|nr:glycine cleavage system aminomethyltransferase GcvT [Prosthecobacter sp.]